MDKTDSKILFELLKNSRISTTQLAKKTNVSRDVAEYRIEKLVKSGIINDFFTEINIEKLNHISALLFLSLKADAEENLIEYIKKSQHISWAGKQSGKWTIGMAIYGASIEEIQKIFEDIMFKFQKSIQGHLFEFYKNVSFFYEKYFDFKTEILKKDNIEYKIDKKDKMILKLLSNNSRITSVEISKETSLSAVAVAKRIKNLEKSNYIIKYSIYINASKLDLYQFYFFIENKNLSERKKLLVYLKAHKKICSIIEYIGDPFVEFCIFSKDPYKIREVIQEINKEFNDNKIIDFLFTHEDFISHGLPKCVFR